jgi:phosphatidylinositol alpha-mannosyltransferase
MRVALVTEYYYPHFGGVTEHVHNLALQYQRMGHEPIVLTSNMKGQGKDESFVRRVGRSQLIYANGSFGRFTIGWNLGKQVENILRQEAVEIIHVHSTLVPTLNLLAQRAGHKLGIPVVATCHSWWPRSISARLLRKNLQKQIDSLAAKIAVSEPVVRANARYFTADWEVIPNGVDVGYFHPNGRVPSDAMASGPRLLFLGRLDPRNGLQTLLEAMPEILRHFPKTLMLVVGDGILLRHYQRQAQALRDRVHFVGGIREERPFYYGSSDLYLCPTTRASFGITLLEAMACGTPMVVSDITGFRELVAGGGEAVMMPPLDPKAWARAVIDLISDPERRAAMGLAGLRKAVNFSWPRIAEKVLKVYERVLR